jgi:low affinity Fe/Cu permease
VRAPSSRRAATFYALAVMLFIVWVLGLISVFSAGPVVHLILATAVLFLLLGLIDGTRRMT